MSSCYSLQKALSQFDFSAAEILLRLQQLTGLIYLNDDDHPVIAFLPQQYQLIQDQHTQHFIRDAAWHYQEQSSPVALEDWVNCQNNATAPTATQFHGGWMGFVGYDYAARQDVAAPLHAQPALYLGQYLSFLKYEKTQGWVFYSREDYETAEHISKKYMRYLMSMHRKRHFN